jgi:SulP family sulfate permease
VRRAAFLARVARLGFLANFLSRTVLVGFLTGVGVQVAISQVGGMLAVPSQKVSPSLFSGALREFFLTLGDLGSASWQTALVSGVVLAILVVFGRWIKAIPGGLVAVIGMIVLSKVLHFADHDISVLGSVPSGLPHIGLPQHVSWSDVPPLAATAGSMFLVILAQSAATSRAYAVNAVFGVLGSSKHLVVGADCTTSVSWRTPTSSRSGWRTSPPD